VTTSSSSFSTSYSFFIIWILLTSSVLFSSSSWIFKVIIWSSSILSSLPKYASRWFKSLVISLRWSVNIFSLFSTFSLCYSILDSKHCFWISRVSSTFLDYSSWALKFSMTCCASSKLWTLSFLFINSISSDLFFSLYLFISSKK